MRAWVAGGCALGGAALGALLMWTLGPSLKSEGAGDKQEAAATEAGGPIGLALDAKTQAAAGIRIEPVASARQATSRTGYAHAVDLSPLAALAADAEAARAAVAASQKQVSRLAALAAQDQAAAPKDVEAARTQLAADQAKLKLSCERVGLDFGAGLARLGCNWIPRIVREAAEGRAALVRIDAIGGLPPAGGSVLVGEGAEAVTVHILGPAVGVDPQLQTAGVLGLVRGSGAARLAVGRVLPVRLDAGAARSGVLVPRTALMRADGAMFVYRAQGHSRFARVALEDGVPMGDGWFFSGGALKAGDPIVTSGATTLLGLERWPQASND
jgi:hypothetical protein